MTEDKKLRLKALLVGLYHAAEAPNEFRMACLLWIALGFGHPVHGQALE